MSKKKEIVDRYLTEHFSFIKDLKEAGKIRWADILSPLIDLVEEEVNSEYVRNRFLVLSREGYNRVNVQPKPEVSFGRFSAITGREDKNKGTKEFSFTADNIPTEEEIVKHFNIDLTKFKISQIWHKTTPGGKYSISVNLQSLKGSEAISIDEAFLEKLNAITPISNYFITQTKENKPKACLIIPKQDAHWNMFDINGQNSIEDRFSSFTRALVSQLEKCVLTNTLEKIVYIVGSDEFNSEWTSMTTKGTPQNNILTYQESFEKVCEFNIETIKLLRFYAPKIEVVLLNGNHDHYVGWHLANLLKQVFKKNESVEVNSDTQNTKIVSYAKNLVLLNHGDSSSPKDLGAKFPVIAHDVWSNYTNYAVICGDKHHERSSDINGVICYQVPQLSKSTSSWSDKKQYIVSKPELLTFLFEEDSLSNIFRKQIK